MASQLRDSSQLEPAFTAAKASNRPVVIDIKIKDERPLPVEALD